MEINDKDFVLGCDVYEGNLNIDEDALRAGGVRFIIIRLNSMSGGHHMDTNFNDQWQQAANFVHFLYFVYNPWCSGNENFLWLNQNIPLQARTVAIDIEVKKLGYAPMEYAHQVKTFLALARARWNVIVYTGPWFLSYLSEWPRDVPYWWARYVEYIHPDPGMEITWEGLKVRLASLDWNPAGAYMIPGACRLWQCTADRYILPGCMNRTIDINVWKGSKEELETWAGSTPVPPPVLTLEERVSVLESEARKRGWLV